MAEEKAVLIVPLAVWCLLVATDETVGAAEEAAEEAAGGRGWVVGGREGRTVEVKRRVGVARN